MTKKEQLALIERAHKALPEMVHGFTNYGRTLIRMCEAEERDYRKGWRDQGQRRGISVKTAAKLFAVKYIADRMCGGSQYTIRDVLHIRAAAIYGAAVAIECEEQIAAAWKEAGINPADLTALDYAELVS